MNDHAPEAGARQAAAQKRQRRLWITLGELVGLLALVVAGLNYWDSHRERANADRRADAQAQAKTALVMTGEADDAGARVMLQPMNPAQAIQSQRYIFPRAVLDHTMEVSAARPQIDLGWVASGLKRALDRDHAPGTGEAAMPVGIVTTYVEDGDTHTDQSVYRLGYAFRTGLLTGRRLTLQGVSLTRRAVKGDLGAVVEARWAAEPRAATP